MQVQSKHKITPTQESMLPKIIKDLGGRFERTVVTRDLIFIPDNRAYQNSFIEQFSLQLAPKGLFIRLREENDLTSGSGQQSILLQAYRTEADLLLSDLINVVLDAKSHRYGDVLRFLNVIGMDKVVELTRKREQYELNFSSFRFAICLDQVEDIASPYLELQSTIDKADFADWQQAIGDLRSQLSLAPNTIATLPYYQLLLQKNQT